MIGRGEVSRICAGLDAEVATFRARSLAAEAIRIVGMILAEQDDE